MKKLNRVVTVLSRIGEIACWVGCGLLLVAIVMVLVGHAELLHLVGSFDAEALAAGISGSIMQTIHLDSYEFTLVVTNGSGPALAAMLILFLVMLLACVALTGLILRNIYRIFKSGMERSPFCSENIRMVRNIGIYSLAIPAVEVVTELLAGLFSLIFREIEHVDVSVALTGVFMGLVVLCLSQYFAYGAKLEEDTEGLV